MVSGQPVAITKAPTLNPVHGRQELDAFTTEPVVDLRSRVLHVVTGPLQRPFIIGRQLPKAEPVVEGDLRCVGNFHAFLQRRAHQHHAAKGPQREATHPFFCVPVCQGNGLAGAQTFQGGNNAGQPATDHQNV